MVKEIFLHGVVEINSLDEKIVFKVNGQRLKAYHEEEDRVLNFLWTYFKCHYKHYPKRINAFVLIA